MESEGEDNCMTNKCVERPFLICCSGFVFMITCTIIAFFADYFSLNDPNDREYAIWEDQRIIDWDMVEAAKLQLL